MPRRHLARMAWRWLRHQPQSALAKWSGEYVSARDGRARRRGTVALTRRLPVAPVRFAATGLVPEGAVLSKAREGGTPEHPGGPTGPPGIPGRACDRAGAWFAAASGSGTVRTDGSRLPERRTARTGHHGHGSGRRRQTEPDRSLDAPLGVRRAGEPRRSARGTPVVPNRPQRKERTDVTEREDPRAATGCRERNGPGRDVRGAGSEAKPGGEKDLTEVGS